VSDDFVVVETSDLRLVFWPQCGGRLISASTGGTELLWRNPDYFDADGRLTKPLDTWQPLDGTMGSWANVGGSKTWPAPQGWSGDDQWPGPPDGVLDSGTWQCTQSEHSSGDRTVVMTSSADSRTGLRVERRFDVPASGTSFTQRNRFTNVGDRPVTWSIWEVCQADTSKAYNGGILRVGVDDEAPPVRMLSVVGTPSLGVLIGAERQLPVQPVIGKLGFPNGNRFLGLNRPDGASLEITFDADPDASYPDGGSRVELWMQYPIPEPLAEFGGLHPQAHLVELEVLGPLTTLPPGQHSELTLRWRLRGPYEGQHEATERPHSGRSD
jgi:Domain of unknown function (DUF4380)